EAVRARFPALARAGADGRPFVWADAPGGSQSPASVIEAVAGRMAAGASNTHGAFPLSEEIDELIAEAHRAGAGFLGCDPDEVVFGQNATSLLLHLSRSFSRTLAPGDEVVVTRLDHDANVRPWILAARDAGATIRWVDVRRRHGPLGDRHAEPRIDGRDDRGDPLHRFGGRVRGDRCPRTRARDPVPRGGRSGPRRAVDRHRRPRTGRRANADVRDPGGE